MSKEKIGYSVTISEDGKSNYPVSLQYVWEPTSSLYSLHLVRDTWNVPKNTSSPLTLPIAEHDTKWFMFSTGNPSSSLLVKLNGSSTTYSVKPDFSISNFNITGVIVTNTSLTTDEVLELYRIVEVQDG